MGLFSWLSKSYGNFTIINNIEITHITGEKTVYEISTSYITGSVLTIFDLNYKTINFPLVSIKEFRYFETLKDKGGKS